MAERDRGLNLSREGEWLTNRRWSSGPRPPPHSPRKCGDQTRTDYQWWGGFDGGTPKGTNPVGAPQGRRGSVRGADVGRRWARCGGASGRQAPARGRRQPQAPIHRRVVLEEHEHVFAAQPLVVRLQHAQLSERREPRRLPVGRERIEVRVHHRLRQGRARHACRLLRAPGESAVGVVRVACEVEEARARWREAAEE